MVLLLVAISAVAEDVRKLSVHFLTCELDGSWKVKEQEDSGCDPGSFKRKQDNWTEIDSQCDGNVMAFGEVDVLSDKACNIILHKNNDSPIHVCRLNSAQRGRGSTKYPTDLSLIVLDSIRELVLPAGASLVEHRASCRIDVVLVPTYIRQQSSDKHRVHPIVCVCVDARVPDTVLPDSLCCGRALAMLRVLYM